MFFLVGSEERASMRYKSPVVRSAETHVRMGRISGGGGGGLVCYFRWTVAHCALRMSPFASGTAGQRSREDTGPDISKIFCTIVNTLGQQIAACKLIKSYLNRYNEHPRHFYWEFPQGLEEEVVFNFIIASVVDKTR